MDTNVLLAALRSSTGASFKLLGLLGSHPAITLCLSSALVLEYEDVLHRHLEHLEISASDVADILDYLCSIARLQEIYFSWRPSVKHPGDEMILDLAVGSACNFIVTFNERDFVGSERFGVQTIRPGEFLRMLE